MRKPTRAFSIRQPLVELILRGIKKKKYRSLPTRIKERVYLYANLRPSPRQMEWRKVGKNPGELPTGAIVGTVEIVGCRWDERYECYACVLKAPRRLRTALIPKNQPQPVFWRPRF